MPSEKILSQKQEYVSSLSKQIKEAGSGILVDYKGVTVAEDTAMRRELRSEGVEYFVVKNTMLRFAAKENGLNDLESLLEGSTALVLSQGDPIAAAKIVAKYADKRVAEKKAPVLTMKGGFVDGAIVDAEELSRYAKLPSKETLVAQVLCGMNSPITGLAIVLNEIAKKLEEEQSA